MGKRHGNRNGVREERDRKRPKGRGQKKHISHSRSQEPALKPAEKKNARSGKKGNPKKFGANISEEGSQR